MPLPASNLASCQEPSAAPDCCDVPAALILEALEKVVASRELRQSESLVRLLRYVVTETLARREHRIKEYTLGVEVFDRGCDFDPKIDTIVRAQARRLRSKMSEYYVGEGARDEVLLEIPKGTYVPEFHRRTEVSRAAQPSPLWRALAGGSIAILLFWTLIPPVFSGVSAAQPRSTRSTEPESETPSRSALLIAPSAVNFGFWRPSMIADFRADVDH